jgi:hypothetical protein
MAKPGRPSGYDQQIADEICYRLADGQSLREIVKTWYMPSTSMIYRWLDNNLSFRDQYAKARVKQAHCLAERAADMASGSFEITDPSFAKLQLDAIKWTAGKLAPKVYGEKVDLNVGGQEGNPVATIIKWQT